MTSKTRVRPKYCSQEALGVGGTRDFFSQTSDAEVYPEVYLASDPQFDNVRRALIKWNQMPNGTNPFFPDGN